MDLLQSSYPEVQRIEFETLADGLEALSLGKIPAFVDNLASIASVIKKYGHTNIKVAADTPYTFELSFGVRKDWPELVSILNKALAEISRSQADQIRKNWISIKFEHGVDIPYLVRAAMVIGVIVVIIFGIIFYWNRRLLAEAKQRKHVEAILAHRNMIHEDIAAGADLQQVLASLITNMELGHEDSLCAILLLDGKSAHIGSIVAPNLPLDFRHTLEGAPVDACLAACAEAVSRRSRVIISDISEDPHWFRISNSLQKIGIKACWLEPVISTDGDVLGLFVFWRQTNGIPGSFDSDLLGEMAMLSTLAVEHHRDLQTLHKLSLAVQHSPNAVMITDVQGASNTSILNLAK